MRRFSTAAIVSLALLGEPASALAGTEIECAEGFTKILENDGEAVCRRSKSVETESLAQALSDLWWGEAACNGETADRQTGISESQSGDWTVTMRFLCKGF